MRIAQLLTVSCGLAAWIELSGCGKRMSDEEQVAQLEASDRQALDAALEGTGLTVPKLRLATAGFLNYNEQSFALENNRVIELRLTKVPLTHAGALAKLDKLQVLWLDGTELESLAFAQGLKHLKSLKVPRNRITKVDDLQELKQLTDLDLTSNRVTDLSSLTAVPELININASGNPGIIRPANTPEKWALKTDANPKGDAPAPPRPANWAASVPASKGKTAGSKVTTDSKHVEGELASLSGVSSNWNIPGVTLYRSGGACNLEMTVDKGKVRAYLQYFPATKKLIQAQDGYIFAEAEPGRKGTATGRLPSTGSGDNVTYTITIESVEGEAQGVHYRIVPSK